MTTATETVPVAKELALTQQESQFAIVARRFRRHKLAVFSLVLIAIIFGLSLLAPWITTFPRDAVDISAPVRPGPPGIAGSDGRIHWLGIDHLGRDLYTRVLFAARISLSIAFAVVIFSETVGVIVGAMAGYYGGITDSLISRLIEFMLSIPLLPILLIVSAILINTDAQLPLPGVVVSFLSSVFLASERESQQIVVLVLLLVTFLWLSAARLMRGMVLSLKEQDFVESLKALGASDARIIFRHLIPNGLAPILVNASLSLGGVIILEASLSFLGLGVQDPTPTWGNMLNLSQSYMFQNPWLPLIPGVPLVIVALGFNFIGDGLRDALDPRLKR